MRNKKMRKQRGFTLVELLIVMAIIGMLAALVGPTLIRQFEGTKQDAAKAQLTNIENGITAYQLDIGKLPKSLDDLVSSSGGNQRWRGPYLKKAQLTDPWGNAYEYRQPGSSGRLYDLKSYGADGQDGGDGDNSDIKSWE